MPSIVEIVADRTAYLAMLTEIRRTEGDLRLSCGSGTLGGLITAMLEMHGKEDDDH